MVGNALMLIGVPAHIVIHNGKTSKLDKIVGVLFLPATSVWVIILGLALITEKLWSFLYNKIPEDWKERK